MRRRETDGDEGREKRSNFLLPPPLFLEDFSSFLDGRFLSDFRWTVEERRGKEGENFEDDPSYSSSSSSTLLLRSTQSRAIFPAGRGRSWKGWKDVVLWGGRKEREKQNYSFSPPPPSSLGGLSCG